jgi:hypothetical protein
MAVAATEYFDKTLADGVFSPDVWSKQVLYKQEANLVMAKLVNRSFESDAKVGRSVIIATISDLSARAKVENTAILYETVAETPVTIPLNIWDYAAIGIEDIVNVQAQINVRSEYEKKIAYALAKDVDTKLATGVAGYSKSFGTLGTPFTDVDVRNAVQALDDANVPEEGRFIVMTPAEKNDKLGLEKWTSILYRGNESANGNGTQVNKGRIGSEIYNLQPYQTTNLYKPAAGQAWNFVGHKDAYALVMQRQPKLHLFYDIDFFTWKIASEMIMGHAELRDDFAVGLKGKA